MIRLIAILTATTLLTACNTEDTSTEPTKVASKPVVQAPQYPEPSSPGFQQFSKQCSSCHRPPMPSQHTAQAWEGVVAVMQKHKAQAGMDIMNKTEKEQVLSYLQQHSRP